MCVFGGGSGLGTVRVNCVRTTKVDFGVRNILLKCRWLVCLHNLVQVNKWASLHGNLKRLRALNTTLKTLRVTNTSRTVQPVMWAFEESTDSPLLDHPRSAKLCVWQKSTIVGDGQSPSSFLLELCCLQRMQVGLSCLCWHGRIWEPCWR